MERPAIELEVREPTGLELGRFDIYLIRQKIYEGELQARCQYKDPQGKWRPLSEHSALSEVLWLLGKNSGDSEGRRVSRFAGWTAKPGDRESGQ